MANKARKDTAQAEPQPDPDLMPLAGGSYVRESDGSLTRTEGPSLDKQTKTDE